MGKQTPMKLLRATASAKFESSHTYSKHQRTKSLRSKQIFSKITGVNVWRLVRRLCISILAVLDNREKNLYHFHHRDLRGGGLNSTLIQHQVFLYRIWTARCVLGSSYIHLLLQMTLFISLWPLELLWLELRVCSVLLLLGLLCQVLWCWGWQLSCKLSDVLSLKPDIRWSGKLSLESYVSGLCKLWWQGYFLTTL